MRKCGAGSDGDQTPSAEPAVTISIRFFGVVPGVGRMQRDNFMNMLKALPRNLESSLRTTDTIQ